MSNVKNGDLAFVVRSRSGKTLGLVCTVLRYAGTDLDGLNWIVEFPQKAPGSTSSGRVVMRRRMWAPDAWLRPIRDQLGNESWFTADPKSLPATTKGDTIDARGEVA